MKDTVLRRSKRQYRRLEGLPLLLLALACDIVNSRQYSTHHPFPQHRVPPTRREVPYRLRDTTEFPKFVHAPFDGDDNSADAKDIVNVNAHVNVDTNDKARDNRNDERRLRRMSNANGDQVVSDLQGRSIGLMERHKDYETGEHMWSLTIDARLRSAKSASAGHTRATPTVKIKTGTNIDLNSGGTQSETGQTAFSRLSRALQEMIESVVGGGVSPDDEYVEGTVVANNQSLIDNDELGDSQAGAAVGENGDGTNQTTGSEWNVTTEIEYTDANSTETNSTHIELDNSTNADNDTSTVVYTKSEDDAKKNKFRPLRMRAILPDNIGNGAYLSKDELKILFEDIISPSLLAWSSSLRVNPVVGNLTVDQNQLVDGETCGPGKDSGLPSIQVPIQHMTYGVPDTDMLIYLNLDFTNVALHPISEQGSKNSGKSSTSSSTTASSDSEFIEALPGRRPTTDTCTGEYLAAASFCSTDQFDRPTTAILHICIDSDFFNSSTRNRTMLTVMHELGHALGFNSISLAHFRNPDGTPITPRSADGSIPDTEVECTGPSSGRRFANVTLPSDEILRFRNVRGGVRVAEIVTPSVLQVVRNQFDCQRLTGAELESGEPLPLAVNADEHACLGDHWERRLFSGDLMNPIIDELSGMSSTRVSTLTLAYFADSGWYQVDLSEAGAAAGWGRGVGCNFVDDQCIGKSGQVPSHNEPFFCNQLPTQQKSTALDIQGCTPDLSRKAICSIGQYDLDLPTEYQYFRDVYGSDVGGADSFMDYCPAFSGFANGLCSDYRNEEIIRASSLESFGRRNSRCVLGNLSNKNTALCMQIACVVEDRSLRVKVDRDWKMCNYDGQKIPVDGVFGNYIACPDPKRVCPTFYCPFDCLGTGGRCNYRTGECLCPTLLDPNSNRKWIRCDNWMLNSGSRNSTSEGPILRPDTNDVVSDPYNHEMPHPDSPLSDYYVPTERSLREDRRTIMPMWAWITCGVGAAVFVLAAIYYYDYRRKMPAPWFQRDGTTETETVTETDIPQVPVNRNKDKMIATVLVDMRIHPNGRGRLPSIPDSTEGILTDSDVSVLDTSFAMSVRSLSSDAVSENATVSSDNAPSNIASDTFPPETPMQIRRRIIADAKQAAKK